MFKSAKCNIILGILEPLLFCKISTSSTIFQDEMTVMCLGAALRLILPQTMGKKINSYFELIKPLVEFKFDTIIAR